MEDTIRRSDAIKELYSQKRTLLAMDAARVAEGVQIAINIIQSLPSADRPQGEWFVYDGESDLYVDIKCSYCRKVYTVDSYKRDDIGFTIEDLKYCPNCGRRIKGVSNGEDIQSEAE